MEEHLVQVCEVEPMLGQIAWPLRLVPDDHHTRILDHKYGFCIYRNKRRATQNIAIDVTADEKLRWPREYQVSLVIAGHLGL